MNSRPSLCLAILLTLVAVGCSSAGPLIPDERNDPPGYLSGLPQPDSNRALWGIWEIAVDPSTLQADVIPLRAAAFHANVRRFLEEGPCHKCLKIVHVEVKPSSIVLDVALTHPFPGSPMYTGFDVRGILLMEGDYSFPQLGFRTTRGTYYQTCLLNPDGFTPLFNAQDYTLPGIFGYSRGAKIPPSWPDPTNTLNAFHAYYSDGQSEDEGGRRAFFAGDTVTRAYEYMIQGGSGLWYAVDASWVPPAGDPPYDLDDFPPEANCPEAYRFDFSVVSGELFASFGWIDIGVDIYDHQGWAEPWHIEFEAPECFDGAGLIVDPPDYIEGEKAHWDIGITNNGGLIPFNGAELLVACANPDDDPFNGTINGYGRFTIPVSPDPPNPEVYSIDPDEGEQGGATDNAAITGANFRSDSTVHLEKAGEPDIDGLDMVFIDGQNIACDFIFTDAALGFWDVVVVNLGNLNGVLPNGFEVVEPSGCNGNLHHDFLGTGDFSGGTHMEAFDAVFVHDTASPADGEFLGYIGGFAGTVVTTYIIDTLVPEDGHGLGGADWGNPHPGSWPVPLSIDIAEESGEFFIVWNDRPAIVELWEYDGKLNGETDASNDGRVFCLDTDGNGGFWNAFFPHIGFAPGIKHFLPDGPEPGTLVEKTEDGFLLPEAWGTPQELICFPDQVLLVLTGSDRGKIRAYDISASPPVLVGEVGGLFSDDLDFGWFPDKSCDMDIDWSDTEFAHCRTVVFGNLKSGGVELVKIDADLTVWQGPVSIPCGFYHSIAINPNTKNVTLWPNRNGSPGEYALIEVPVGW